MQGGNQDMINVVHVYSCLTVYLLIFKKKKGSKKPFIAIDLWEFFNAVCQTSWDPILKNKIGVQLVRIRYIF